MAKYSKQNKVSEKTVEEATQIARATQKPGQTKEQTRLIVQGIQKGIEQYKKLHKAKSRELDKKLHKVSANQEMPDSYADHRVETASVKSKRLPWILLIISWLGFVFYIFKFQ